jgi:hypothetical protein
VRAEIEDALLYQYVYTFFDRSSLFDENIVSSLGNLTLGEYDFLGFFLLLLLFCGLGVRSFYEKQSRALQAQLGIYGLRGLRLGLIRVAVLTLVLTVAGLVIYLLGCAVAALSGLGFVACSWYVPLWLLALAFSMAAYFHLFYVAAGDAQTGVRLLTGIGALMVVASGILVPSAYLPHAVATVGSYTPLAAWARYAQGMLGGQIAWRELGICVAVGLTELGISEVIAWHNT